jgi:outer membrane immunogenic protein
MKNLVSFALIALTCTIAQGQYALKTGSFQANGGFGLSGWALPVYVGADYGFDKNISLGGDLSFSFLNTVVSANANYHFVEILQLEDVFDVYGGVNMGFFIRNQRLNPEAIPPYYNNSVPVNIGIQVGGRYYFNKNFAVNLELGGGIAFSGGKIGISYLLR